MRRGKLTSADQRHLKKHWGERSATELAADLGSTPAEVRRAARRLGLKTPRRPINLDPRPLVVLVGLSLVVFANNLPNRFVYDDDPAIVQNEAAHGVGQLVRIFTTPSFWPPAEAAHHYRPVTTFSFAVNYSLGTLDPAGYHYTNNLLHGLAAWVVYLVLVEAGLTTAAALLAAVLFVVHPVHVEAVSWVNGRTELLAGLFLMLAMLGHARGARGWWPGRLLAVLAFVLAAMSKETGFVYPGLALAWDALITARGRWREFLATLREGWWEYLLCAGVLAAFAWHRTTFVGSATATIVTPMASPLGGASFLPRLYTGAWVIARYLGLLIWPAELSVDYSPQAITRINSLLDPQALMGLAALVGYLVATVVAARRRPALGFVLVAAAIILAPAANILFPIGTIMAERLLYLPALAVLAPAAVALTPHEGWPTRGALVLAAVLTIALTARTVVRNRDWRDEMSLFQSAYRVSPDSAMANKNLASALHNAGRNAEAIPLAQRATELLPEFPDAHYVLGNAYVMTDRAAEAVPEYEACLRLTPRHRSAHVNLGAAYHILGRYADALRETELGLSINPDLALGWYNRVHTLVAMNDLPAARRALDEAIRRFPDFHGRAEAEAKVNEGERSSAGADGSGGRPRDLADDRWRSALRGRFQVMSDGSTESFDCVAYLRQARDRLSAEIRDMSYEELIRYLRTHRYADPVLQRLADRAAQQAAAGDRPASGR